MKTEIFFNPNSVAVVGASREPGKVGYEIFAALQSGGYEGIIYPVNPKAKEVGGLTCYKNITAIGSQPDLVVIVVPARFVAGVMEECATLKVKGAIIITAGFKETGKVGKLLEDTVLAIAQKNGIRIIGPNCLGLMVPSSKLNVSFGGDLPAIGNLGYLSQSGALLTSILDMARADNIGFSKLVSVGNKADINEVELINALAADDDTKVIAGYLESVSDGNAFVKDIASVSVKKPVLLMKSGGTGAGAKAASSHTGSLAGSETAYEAVFTRTGVIRCYSIKEQFDYIQAFTSQPLPRGNRVAIITNAGGPGIMAADAVEREGLAFSELSKKTKDLLIAGLPAAASANNPVDVLGDALADRYRLAIDEVHKDDGVDAMIIILTPQSMTEFEDTAQAVIDAMNRKSGKPIMACFMGAEKVADGIKLLRDASVPVYGSPEDAVRSLKAMITYKEWCERPKRELETFSVNKEKVEEIIASHLSRDMREIGEQDAKEILKAYGFAIPEGVVATTADEAVTSADTIGYPIVMKIWSPDILHKSDVGGVRVGLENAQQVRDAFDLMMLRIPQKEPNANIIGVLVQEMCACGLEVILGVNADPNFGPLMMFGMGGTLVEVFKDISFALAPLTKNEVLELLKATKTYKMLEGVRGGAGVDIDLVVEGLQRLSQLVTDFPQIKELDINPYVLGPQGIMPVAVDARISVENVTT